MVKIEISSSVFIVVENTSDTLWSILGNLVCFADSTREKTRKTNVIIDERIKENSFDKFVDACLEEFGHNFRGSILIIEDIETGEPSLSKNTKRKNLILDAVDSIFRKVYEKYEENYCLSVSYLEMCYEYILDLLDDKKERIQHSKHNDFQAAVQNVNKQEILSPDVAFDLITKGTRRRTYEDTSHTIFNISLTQKRKTNVQGVIVESHLNFIFLSGCVDKKGAFGDQLRKGCTHFSINQVVDLLDEKNWNNVKAQDSILQLVLKQFLGGIRIICTVSSNSFEDSLSFLRFTGASTENELVTLSADGFPLHSDLNPQDEPDYITEREETTRMYRKSASHFTVHNTQLETIEEEEEEMEETRFSFDNMTCKATQKVSQDGENYRQLNQDRQHKSLSLDITGYSQELLDSLQGIHGLEMKPDVAVDSQDYISYYQKKYEELREFTSNEKKIYEESFNVQLSEANLRIQDLEKMNKSLAKQLRETMYRCKMLSRSQSDIECDESGDKISAEKELAILRVELEKSEQKRNECEIKLELLEKNFHSRSKELVESLEDAWKELSGYNKDFNEHHSNDDSSSDEDDMKNEMSITHLKNEIMFLKKENARYSHLSHQIEEYLKIKKSLVQESTLHAKIADLEKEVRILKETNTKLTEDLNKKDLELKEVCATYSLYAAENNLLKGENATISKKLKDQNSEYDSSKEKPENTEESEKIKLLSQDLEEKIMEISKLNSENIILKQKLDTLNKIAENLPKEIDKKEEKISCLMSENSELKDSIFVLENKNKDLLNTIDKNSIELKKLASEHSVQEEKINSLVAKETLVTSLKEKMENLSKKLNNSETRVAQLVKVDDENMKLKDEIMELKYKVKSLIESSEDNFTKIKELISENSMLKEEIYAHIRETELLTGCLKEKKTKVKEYDYENEKLKEEIHVLKQNTSKISKSLDEKMNKIQDIMDENVMLKDEISSLKTASKRIASETAMKIRDLETENSSLKKNICSLTSDLKVKMADLKNVSKKEEEDKKAMGDLANQVSVLKKEISLLHKENGSLSKMLQEKRKKNQKLVPRDTDFSSEYNLLEKENTILNCDRTKLLSENESLIPREEVKGRSQFTCSTLNMDLILEEEQKSNRLRRRVAQQRRMLGIAQKKDLQMRSNIEMCITQLDDLKKLRDDNILQNHRIMQLQLQAQHDDYVHRTRTDCLEAFIQGLRSENVILKTQLNHVNCKLKKLFVSIKMIRNNSHLKLKQVAVQTVPSSSDSSLSGFNMMKSDSTTAQESDAEPHFRSFGTQYESGCLQTLQAPNDVPKEGQNIYNVVRIKSKQSLEISLQKNLLSKSGTEKKKLSLGIYPKGTYNRSISSLCPDYSYPKNYIPEGAEGWARLGREFDLQQNQKGT